MQKSNFRIDSYKVKQSNLKLFGSVIQVKQSNYNTGTNYIENRATNASAESFNAKLKLLDRSLEGVKIIPFFIYRLDMIFA